LLHFTVLRIQFCQKMYMKRESFRRRAVGIKSRNTSTAEAEQTLQNVMSFSLHFSFNFSEEADDELPLLRAVPITTQLRVCGRGCARCGSLLHPKYRARISSYTRYYCTSLYVTYRPAVSLGRTIFTTCPLFKPKYRATGSPACMRGS